jgi:signal transduction histidine kinase/ActR/RegA family two-component response regulator
MGTSSARAIPCRPAARRTMGIFGRAQSERDAIPSLTRMLTAGASLPEIMHDAVQVLLARNGADRAGVWMESTEYTQGEEGNALMFRGVVAERNGDATPAEWKKLSPEAPLVRLLARGETVELQLDGTLDGMSMSALLEMRRTVCAPVQTKGSLRGIVFAGARDKKAKVEKSTVEQVASALAIAAQVEDERRRACERQEDVVSAGRMLGTLGSSAPASAALAEVVDNCVKGSGSEVALHAVFAAIGETQGAAPRTLGEAAATADGRAGIASAGGSVEFSWRRGEAAWTSALEREPLLNLWQRALETRRVEGGKPGPGPSREVARVVAFPLEGDGNLLGVLVAGLRHRDASLAALERLELRAAIAAQALLARKRSREAQQQRDWIQALLQSAPDAVILLEHDETIRKLNEQAHLLLGNEKRSDGDGPEPQHFTEIFQPRVQSQVKAWLEKQVNRRSLQAAQLEKFECELFNGTKVRLDAIEATGGGISAVRLSAPERSKAKREEQRAEAELRQVIEWLEEGVVLFDERQEIRVMNSRFAQMAGLQPHDGTGAHDFHGLVARLANQTAEPEKFAARWLAVAHGSESGIRDEVQLLLPAPRVLERAARPVLDGEGARLGRVEIYRDLTAQRVFHSKLIQTEKLAALGQMVTSIAHELSNPLTSILGYAQRMQAHNGAKEPSHDVRQILHEAERASTILKQLLLTPQNSRPERRKVLLNHMVRRTLELQSPSLRAENVHIEVELDPQLPFVLGEDGQLQQVLMNLIGNARQALEQKSKSGTIRIRTKRLGGTHVLLEISDDGPGIPQAILTKIFDPFFTTKPAGIGTGLGLSIVLAIVRDHGGQVHVTSPPGGGATFSIELPAVPSDARQLLPTDWSGQREGDHQAGSEENVLAGEREEAALGPWAGSRVLVVEDEATVAQLIADVLKDEGLEVEVLLDGREALRRAATEDYDLVICDMKMPDVDGEQFYRRLAKTENPLSRKVLFVTGDVLAAHTRQFLQRNALAHLAKPFRVEELTEKVRQVLTDTSPRQPRGTRTKVARNADD